MTDFEKLQNLKDLSEYLRLDSKRYDGGFNGK